MRGTIFTIVAWALTGCTLVSVSEAEDSETSGETGSPPRTSAGEPGEPLELGWCCACEVNVGDALACTPATAAECDVKGMTWCESNAQGDTSACETACNHCVCDCELGPSPGCDYDQATACASECDLVWCCACADLADDYIGASLCDVVPQAECMGPDQRWCSPDGIFAYENPVFDCWQQCQPEQFGWCCECAGLEQSPNCKPANFFNCAEPGWAWCDELDAQGQPTGCVDACEALTGWCCDCGLGQQGWWDCKQSNPDTCVGADEAWCELAPCLSECAD